VALTERLQIIVTADGKGAAREFQQIGATAERELGRTDDRIKKLSSGLISSGTQIALAGGIATAGVFKLAQAAGDYEEAASAAEVIFGDASESIEQFGKDAITTAGLSRRASVEAANSFGTFGKAAGLTGQDLAKFSTDLTQLAGDLASFKNTTTDQAITAIGAALRGESEPIRQYGVLLDDATLKQEALELGIYDGVGALDQQTKVLAAQAAIFRQTTDAQGDFARTSDSLSNQTRSLSAEFENLQVSLGEGAVPIFSELVGAASSALGAFQNLSPATQDLVGRIGAIGAVGATAVGGLSVLAGGALRAVDTFKDLGSRGRDADGNLSKMGRTARITGAALGGAGLAFTVFQLASAFNDATRDAVGFDTALNNLRGATLGADIDRFIAEGAANTAGVLDDASDSLDRFFRLGQSPPTVELGEFNVQVDDLRRYLRQLYREDPEQLERVLDRLSNLEPPDTVGFGIETRAEFQGLQDDIAGYEDNLQSAERASRSLSGETSFLTQILDGAAKGQEDAANAADNFASGLERAGAETELFAALLGDVETRVDGFSNAISNSTALDDFLSSGLALNDSLGSLREVVGALPKDIDVTGIAFADLGEDGSAALGRLLDVGRSVQGVLETALRFGGAKDAVAEADRIRESLRKVFAEADITGGRFEEYLEIIGLTPEQVNTAITVSGEVEARAKLETFRDTAELLEAPIELQVAVAELELEGNLEEASDLVQGWFQDIQDGFIDNPWLLALGLGPTRPVEEEIDQTKRAEEAKPPARIPVDANTGLAKIGLANLRQSIPFFGGAVPVTADTSSAIENLNRLKRSFPIFGVREFVPFGGAGELAVGGPVNAGESYFVNEPSLGGELFRPSTDGFVMNAADTDRLIRGVEALVQRSGSGGGDTINVYETAGPRQTAAEIIRARNANKFLSGASL